VPEAFSSFEQPHVDMMAKRHARKWLHDLLIHHRSAEFEMDEAELWQRVVNSRAAVECKARSIPLLALYGGGRIRIVDRRRSFRLQPNHHSFGCALVEVKPSARGSRIVVKSVPQPAYYYVMLVLMMILMVMLLISLDKAILIVLPFSAMGAIFLVHLAALRRCFSACCAVLDEFERKWQEPSSR